MAASTEGVLEDIERRRVQLQQNVDKLRQALSLWTTWELDYETLKEEIQNAEDASPLQIREIARGIEGSLVTDKEVEELLCKNAHTERTANQVVDMISRRVDYVQKNSATIERQLDAAEKQLAGVDFLLEPGLDNEEGLPMMDIEEELDEEGNEVSTSVNQTGKGAAEVIEVLRKAGLQKAELDKKNVAPPATRTMDDVPPTTAPSASSDPEVSEPGLTKKSVSFASDVDVEPSAKKALETDGYNEDLAAFNFTTGTKVVELDADGNEIASYPIIPQGESAEDAELRRQMLQYGLSEVGQIVAELDLDRPTVSYSDDETDDEYDDYNTEDEEEEDEHGRSTKPVLTDEYRKQMMELEKKLGARMLENIGPQSDDNPLAEHIGDIRTMRVHKDEQFDETLDTSKSEAPASASDKVPKKKGVRFADDLDVSEAPQPVQEAVQEAQPAPTISHTIVERSAPASSTPVEPLKPAKVSRFKSARAGLSQPPQMLPTPPIPEAPSVPTGPADRTLASTITEHTPLPSEPQAPDEFDPIILNREIQTEYNKARNRFIQQQGGFKATEEDEESPIVEERDGRTKKVSRFMAARLKADGM
ncbi:hypothetical protein EJ02DRAFT_459576 [Clathrospora elynae]|uniref:DUF3835 domain-containing protein n=1 Tax=Clathrospora elynae TaxID=706981 RepID=A0A6A5SG70_9PLEO|nr:hypothetical protein EJ02DRAFT_459576 [Clathrospora elynae]